MENSITQNLPQNRGPSGGDDSKGSIGEKFGQMKSILEEINSNYSIADDIVYPPIEITTSNMESYVGKPKYLKDR